jgi:hypothetical protein
MFFIAIGNDLDWRHAGYAGTPDGAAKDFRCSPRFRCTNPDCRSYSPVIETLPTIFAHQKIASTPAGE